MNTKYHYKRSYCLPLIAIGAWNAWAPWRTLSKCWTERMPRTGWWQHVQGVTHARGLRRCRLSGTSERNRCACPHTAPTRTLMSTTPPTTLQLPSVCKVKWLEVEEVGSTSAKQKISKLRTIFATSGLPVHCVTDSGPPDTSLEFSRFLKSNGINIHQQIHIIQLAMVKLKMRLKLLKIRLKSALISKENTELALSRFLLAYRTSDSTINEMLAKLMFNRQLRIRLDLSIIKWLG